MLSKAFAMDTDSIIAEVKKSNLRGRGGAGFPTGVKWGFMPRDPDVTKYLVVNADEGEPGTFKDRKIMELDPHRLVEGCIITAWTLGLDVGYIFVRGELQHAIRRLERAIAQAYEKGHLGKNIHGKGFDFDLYVHTSAGAYICGEETGLIEGLEGKPGQPRMKPPFPAVVGVFQKPTLVNNVETIAAIPFIIERGGEFWAKMGIEKNGGPKLYGLSGHINRPGVYGGSERGDHSRTLGALRRRDARGERTQSDHPWRIVVCGAAPRLARCTDGVRDAPRGRILDGDRVHHLH